MSLDPLKFKYSLGQTRVIALEIAVSTLFCLHKPFHEALPDIIQAGTSRIELVDAGPHILSQTRVERLLEMKASYDLRYALHAPFTDVNIAATDPYMREVILQRLETTIKWASTLEARALVFHPGNSTAAERFSQETPWVLNLLSVKRLLRFAEEYGVKAMIENVPEPFPYVMKSVEDFERFYEEVDKDVEMVLDVAHANIRGEIFSFIRRLGNRIGHVHVSDNDGSADMHLQVGKGTIDWDDVVSALKESSYGGWITIESYDGVAESLRILRGLI